MSEASNAIEKKSGTMPNTPFFDPNSYENKTPIPVKAGKASAIPVLAVYRDNVQGKTAVEIYFALVGRNGCLFDPETGKPTQCAIVRGTWWLTGTRDDDKARGAFANVLKAMSYTTPLKSLEAAVVTEWVKGITKVWRPVTLILENDPGSDGRYQRIRFVNPLGAPISDDYAAALNDGGVIADATSRANETAVKVERSTGGSAEHLEVADDIPF